MLELVRGYSACLFDDAAAGAALEDVVEGLGVLRRLLVTSEVLRGVITDSTVPAEARGAVLSDLLEARARPEVGELATFAVEYERSSELPKTYEQVYQLGEERLEQAAASDRLPPEPPIGRSGALERLRGFAERVFEQLIDQQRIDSIEDELFRFARIAEGSDPLRTEIAGSEPAAGMALLGDLLDGKVENETLRLLTYVLRCGRGRDLVGATEYLVELAAAERGRRVAEVRAAVELDDAERDRLTEALTRRMRRPVELRIVNDPSVIGGLDVTVGDTVIDGTVRHRLEQLRENLIQLT